jgi:predicted nucleotide-binding protein
MVSLPDLKRPKKDTIQKVKERLSKGREILANADRLLFPLEGNELSKEVRGWSDYNLDFLKRSFVDESVAKEYAAIAGPIIERVKARIRFLESVSDRLELVEEQIVQRSQPSVERGLSTSHDVFLVHGHDEGANQEVSRFVESLDFNLIRLSEQPHGGRTLIEKLEDYSNVGFVIALLTPDDMGVPVRLAQHRNEWKPRARQNAIFELGVFVGRLGRGKVCMLYKPGVEIPSDYHGVGYVKMGSDKGWKIDLVREMKKAGLDVDLNKVA